MIHQYSSFKRTPRTREDDPFQEVTANIPKSIHTILKAKSIELNQPISKLIAMALDNELEAPQPFNYPVDLPTSTFVQDAYTDESGRIFSFLEKVNYGMSLDHLLLLRRNMGIMNKSVFLLGFRELLQTNMIEDFYPEKSKFRYDTTYRYYRVKKLEQKDIKTKRKKRKFIESVDTNEDDTSV